MFSNLPNFTARRGKTFVTTAGAAAFLLSTVVSAMFLGREGLRPMLSVIAPSTLAACGLAYLFWRIMMKKRESKKRGAIAGILTGICALPFAITPIVFLQSLTENLLSSNPVIETLGIILISTALTFIYGGFLAPIAGGFAGAMIAKNNVSEDDVQDAFD